jgi:hypothetical protein
MSEQGRVFGKFQIALGVIALAALLAIDQFPAMTHVTIPVAIAAAVGIWIIARLNGDDPDC